jgi:serine O-acetyltransferase
MAARVIIGPQDAPHTSLFAQWKEDLSCVFDRDPAARSLLEVMLIYPGVHAVMAHRISHKLWKRGHKFSARFLAFLTRLFTNVDIHPGATIGRRLFIDHAACVVIGETAEVGDDCTLYHGTTLGGTSWHKTKRHPTLGNGVLVGAGAKILGPITVGDKVRVGANSIVVKDVPPCCTVVGIPGKIVQRKGTPLMDARGHEVDEQAVPDPIGKSISCLMERIDLLEAKVASYEKKEKECGHCEADDVCLPVHDGRITQITHKIAGAA